MLEFPWGYLQMLGKSSYQFVCQWSSKYGAQSICQTWTKVNSSYNAYTEFKLQLELNTVVAYQFIHLYIYQNNQLID